MKKIATKLFLLSILSNPALASEVSDLGFLSGCWQAELDGVTYQENWSNTDGGVMLSTVKALSPKGLEGFEFLKIQNASGKTLLTPYLDGKEVPSFELVSLKDKVAAFKNDANEFPKEITYAAKKDALDIKLSGRDNDGELIEFVIPMKKSACPK